MFKRFKGEEGGIIWTVLAIIGLLVVLGLIFGTCGDNNRAMATPPNPDHKVTLCHRTGSATNPYVVITTDIASDGYVKGGHDSHEQVGNGLGGDIIPAYTYTSKDEVVFNYPGKNLDTVIGGSTGADILANGCVVPQPTESPTPTETPTPTDTPTPPGKPTCHDSGTCHVRHNHPKPPSTTGKAPKETAFTGSDMTVPGLIGGSLALLGGGSLWLRRRYAE